MSRTIPPDLIDDPCAFSFHHIGEAGVEIYTFRSLDGCYTGMVIWRRSHPGIGSFFLLDEDQHQLVAKGSCPDISNAVFAAIRWALPRETKQGDRS